MRVQNQITGLRVRPQVHFISNIYMNEQFHLWEVNPYWINVPEHHHVKRLISPSPKKANYLYENIGEYCMTDLIATLINQQFYCGVLVSMSTDLEILYQVSPGY